MAVTDYELVKDPASFSTIDSSYSFIIVQNTDDTRPEYRSETYLTIRGWGKAKQIANALNASLNPPGPIIP